MPRFTDPLPMGAVGMTLDYYLGQNQPGIRVTIQQNRWGEWLLNIENHSLPIKLCEGDSLVIDLAPIPQVPAHRYGYSVKTMMVRAEAKP